MAKWNISKRVCIMSLWTAPQPPLGGKLVRVGKVCRIIGAGAATPNYCCSLRNFVSSNHKVRVCTPAWPKNSWKNSLTFGLTSLHVFHLAQCWLGHFSIWSDNIADLLIQPFLLIWVAGKMVEEEGGTTACCVDSNLQSINSHYQRDCRVFATFSDQLCNNCVISIFDFGNKSRSIDFSLESGSNGPHQNSKKCWIN